MEFPDEIIQLVPKRIGRLAELANNLWWSWDEEGRQVFRSLDYELWRASGHNPVKQLRDISPDKLAAAARDPAFLELYDSIILKFDDLFYYPDRTNCYQIPKIKNNKTIPNVHLSTIPISIAQMSH